MKYRMQAARRARRRSWPVMAVFAFIVGLQLLVAIVSIDLLSAVRAYCTGESLYSKGQKDALIHLTDYADGHRESDYQLFLQSLVAPLGDRAAREAMQLSVPDVDAARRGLLQSGTHADDIPGVIRLFLWFAKTRLMAEAISTWAEGDQVIELMRRHAEMVHGLVTSGEVGASEVVGLRAEVTRLNQRLTVLEVRFAKELGDGARLSQRLLIAANFALAVLLSLTGLGFVRRTARLQAATEEEVRARQESLQRLLDSAAEGLYGVDAEGRCTFVNKAALVMLGYETELDLRGLAMHALIHHSHADRSTRAHTESKIFQACQRQSEVHVVDEVFWRRDGSSFPVEYWSHPMSRDGRPDGAVVTFFDISERVGMLAALRQGEIRMTRLVDAVNDGVITIDASERIVLFNRAAERLFGVPSKEAIGGSVERFIPVASAGSRSALARELLVRDIDAANSGSVQELTGRRANGETFPIETSLSRFDSEQGPLVTAVLRDVSELRSARAERQAREALEATSRAKTEFLSRMSHELRTPLHAVLSFSQLLRLDASQPATDKQLQRIRFIESAGTHLLALVNDVLDLSRVEAGQMTVIRESVHLLSSIEDALTMVVPLAAAEGVSLWIDGIEGDLVSPVPVDAGDVFLWADRLRLRQILVNLLSNAIKYNRPEGQVRISWQVDRDRCEVRVRDDGPGMAPEKLARLFEPFNRLGAEQSKVEGTGIGLVLSRGLAELMNGTLSIDSALDRGTLATLQLDCSAQTPIRSRIPSSPSQHGELDATMRVLYAEDNEVNVEIVRQVLGLRPSVVLEVAETGAAAFQMARRDPPHLMLVDMNLGDMTGIELITALRADAATAGIRLVALSADALPEQISAAIAAGVEEYLTKPLNFRELLEIIDERRGIRIE